MYSIYALIVVLFAIIIVYLKVLKGNSDWDLFVDSITSWQGERDHWSIDHHWGIPVRSHVLNNIVTLLFHNIVLNPTLQHKSYHVYVSSNLCSCLNVKEYAIWNIFVC